ncbi:hypothetical protein Y032_0044g1056 [Ancylostoma ceylanicum]|nr:hypothetical protein Y032_0044g1056 [Ancylostoma ceylanicum]
MLLDMGLLSSTLDLIFPKHHTSGPVLVVYKPSGITTCMSPQMMMLMKIYLIPVSSSTILNSSALEYSKDPFHLVTH